MLPSSLAGEESDADSDIAADERDLGDAGVEELKGIVSFVLSFVRFFHDLRLAFFFRVVFASLLCDLVP